MQSAGTKTRRGHVFPNKCSGEHEGRSSGGGGGEGAGVQAAAGRAPGRGLCPQERLWRALVRPLALLSSKREAVSPAASAAASAAAAAARGRRQPPARGSYLRFFWSRPGPCLMSPATCRGEAVPGSGRFSHAQPSPHPGSCLSPPPSTGPACVPARTHMCTCMHARCIHTHVDTDLPSPLLIGHERVSEAETHARPGPRCFGRAVAPRSRRGARQQPAEGPPSWGAPLGGPRRRSSGRIRAVSYWNNLNLRRFSPLLSPAPLPT